MKSRIIGTLLLLLVLFGIYVVTENDTSVQQPSVPTMQNNDSAFKSLNVN